MLESGFFKGLLPVVDPLYQIGHPLTRCSRIDIINDRLLWLDQLPMLPFFPIFRLWLQPPPNDKFLVVYFLLIIAIDGIVLGKISYPFIKQSFVHGCRRQQDQRGIQLQRNSPGRIRRRRDRETKRRRHPSSRREG